MRSRLAGLVGVTEPRRAGLAGVRGRVEEVFHEFGAVEVKEGELGRPLALDHLVDPPVGGEPVLALTREHFARFGHPRRFDHRPELHHRHARRAGLELHGRDRGRDVRLGDHAERVAGLRQHLGRVAGVGRREELGRVERAHERLRLRLPWSPTERPRAEVELPVVKDRVRVVGVNLLDADDRVIVADEFLLHVALERGDLSLVGSHQAVPRPAEEDEQARVSDHEPGLSLLPGVSDQGRAEDVGAEEGEQDREAFALVNPLLHGRRAVPLLEEGGVREDRREGADADDREFQGRQEPVHGVHAAEERPEQGTRPADPLLGRGSGRVRFLGGSRHEGTPRGGGSASGRDRGAGRTVVGPRRHLARVLL